MLRGVLDISMRACEGIIYFSLPKKKRNRSGQKLFTIGAIMLGILREAFISLLGDSGWFAEGE